MLRRTETPILDIAYESRGPADGRPLLLLHGWPDDPRTFDGLLPPLHQAGFRTLAPWLRGFGPTRFLADTTIRSGEIAAMAQDVLDMADALNLPQVSIIGHDWGARIAYWIAAAAPERVERIAALSVGWQPGELATPALKQAQAFWYQWFMATERGAELVRRDRKAFARFQWETWSPPGWFTEADFAATAAAFENPDWAEITLHAYRVRWGAAQPDVRYEAQQRRYLAVRQISVPTLMIQGVEDRCVLTAASADMAAHFSGVFRRVLLERVGHFPTREAPGALGPLLVEFLRR